VTTALAQRFGPRLIVGLAVSFGIVAFSGPARRLLAARQARSRVCSPGPPPTHLRRVLSRFATHHGRTPEQAGARMLAALLDDIARRCASGESLRNGFVAALARSELQPSFAHATQLLHGGATIAEALASQAAITADQALAVHVLRLCATQGGNVSVSLDRAAATLRERDALAQERIAQSAQARLSARVLTLLPVGFSVWTLATTPSVRHFVVTPPGLVCVTLGLVLNLTGWRLMNRIIGARR
jgi:Flp pilus assembly protein TadB